MMGAHDRRVDHLYDHRRPTVFAQGVEHQFEEAGFRPAAELLVDRVPHAEMLVEIAPRSPGPRDPEDAVENLAVILRRPSAFDAPYNHDGFEKCPFLIRHQAANQDRLPKNSLESRFALGVNPLCQQALGHYSRSTN